MFSTNDDVYVNYYEIIYDMYLTTGYDIQYNPNWINTVIQNGIFRRKKRKKKPFISVYTDKKAVFIYIMIHEKWLK